jgi:hypothetical protein
MSEQAEQGVVKKVGQKYASSRFKEVAEPDEKLVGTMWGYSSRWWQYAPLGALYTTNKQRWIFVTDRNVYFCRERLKSLEVMTKQPLGSVKVDYTGHRFRVGTDHAMSHAIGPNAPKVCRDLAEYVNKRFDESNA